MRFSVILTGLVLAFAATVPASAQELWRGVSAGMSVDEVLTIVPDAQPASEQRSSGVRLGATAGGLTIADRPWRAEFLFDTTGLNAVILEPEAAVEPVIYTVLFDPVLTDLREAYGEPLNCDRSSIGRSCEWRSPEKKIRLGYMEVGNLYNLYIMYEARDAAKPPL